MYHYRCNKQSAKTVTIFKLEAGRYSHLAATWGTRCCALPQMNAGVERKRSSFPRKFWKRHVSPVGDDHLERKTVASSSVKADISAAL